MPRRCEACQFISFRKQPKHPQKEKKTAAAKRGKDFRDMKKDANYASLRERPAKPFEELKSLAYKGSGSSLVKLQRSREAPQ